MAEKVMAVPAQVDRGVRPVVDEGALAEATAAAWKRHAQRVKYQWPGGAGSYAALQTPELMAELGFTLAVREVLAKMESSNDC
jgi:hypothetical protein